MKPAPLVALGLALAIGISFALAQVNSGTPKKLQDKKTVGEGAPLKTVKTRIGELNYEAGFPTKETVEKLYSEMDFQRAVMAYQYAEPLVIQLADAEAAFRIRW